MVRWKRCGARVSCLFLFDGSVEVCYSSYQLPVTSYQLKKILVFSIKQETKIMDNRPVPYFIVRHIEKVKIELTEHLDEVSKIYENKQISDKERYTQIVEYVTEHNLHPESVEDILFSIKDTFEMIQQMSNKAIVETKRPNVLESLIELGIVPKEKRHENYAKLAAQIRRREKKKR